MQNYQHDLNSGSPVNQNSGYDPNSIAPNRYTQDKIGKKTHTWGYVLTALISVVLTVVLMLTLFLNINLKKIMAANPIDAAIENGAELPSIFFEDNVDNQEALEKLNIMFKLLKDNYYEELSDSEIINAMMVGMLENIGSPYTFYMSPEYVIEMEDSMSGSYSGIGATVEKISNYYQISDIVEDSPADQAGLMINDMFVKVDGHDATEYEDVSSLASDIRGEEGTSVEVIVFRPSENKEMTFDIVRKNITNSNIHSRMLNSDIGYVRIVSFNKDVAENFIDAVDQLQEQGAKHIVFDLRNNGGGYVDEVLAMLDYLLPEGTMITEVGRRNGEPYELEERSDEDMGVPENMRYICLMNNNSASASELFAGCLRDWGKAELVGKTSFGKGVGTITKYLSDGSAVQITNFYYNLPNGENINDIGLDPDYEVELPDEYENVIVSRIPENEDAQLEKAIKVLSEK